jgi:O-antigen ligase
MALLIAIVAVVFIISLLRSLFKLALTAALIGIIFVVFFGYSPNDVLTKGKQLASNSSSYAENTIKPIIDNVLKNAHVK